jgi:hypothetical protein
MIDQKNSVVIALIHNNNVRRNDYIRPQLDELARALGPLLIEKIEISFQSELKPHDTCMAFLRDIMYRKLDREWHRYRLLRPLTLLRDISGFLKGSFIKYVIERDSTGASWKKNSSIEVMVTEKHVRAWGIFLDSGADFLICFEDDAVFKDDSAQKIKDVLGFLHRRNIESRVYADLAGGCKLDRLKLGNLEAGQEGDFKFYSKPVTNTACVYLMSRQLVVAFHSILAESPWLRLIGIDWMMNSLFIQMEKNGMESICIHAAPTVFRHGTTTGEYVSWQAQVPH